MLAQCITLPKTFWRISRIQKTRSRHLNMIWNPSCILSTISHGSPQRLLVHCQLMDRWTQMPVIMPEKCKKRGKRRVERIRPWPSLFQGTKACQRGRSVHSNRVYGLQAFVCVSIRLNNATATATAAVTAAPSEVPFVHCVAECRCGMSALCRQFRAYESLPTR